MREGTTCSVAVRDAQDWVVFRDPVRILEAASTGEVMPALREIETRVEQGLCAAGFVSYEAAPAFDRALKVKSACPLPLLWFGLFREADRVAEFPAFERERCDIGAWIPSETMQEYRQALERIRRYLQEGDTYQVNYTFRLRAGWSGNPLGLFGTLWKAQRGPFSAFVDTGRYVVCSASPESFFSLNGDELVSRPMKGTAHRGLGSEDDAFQMENLRNSAKNRAENVMIVDMVRNDMGRIADSGSVEATRLYTVERYPTVLQMTSTVGCRTRAGLTDIMSAMFPCASVTGAPKARTMEIIAEMERGPRGVYTGCIGYVLPGGRARFSVAIRTVAMDRVTGVAEYGVGGGIVWDSNADDEYEECLTKSAVLTAAAPEFDLLETMLWEPGGGYFLLELHLERLRQSAEYFCRPADIRAIGGRLAEFARGLGGGCRRVRLRVGPEGTISVASEPLQTDRAGSPRVLKFAAQAVDESDRFLYHKTTRRAVYESAVSGVKGCDDVVLWNRGNEVTETTIANIVVEKRGRRITPPVQCGLLPGVFREYLLARGEIEEDTVTTDDLRGAERIYLVNSVRKWMDAVLASGEG